MQPFSPHGATQDLAIVSLQPPFISERIECWSRRSAEKGRHPGDLNELKHLIILEKNEEVMNAADMDIIDDEQCVFFKMWINIVILQIWKWKAVGTIQEYGL